MAVANTYYNKYLPAQAHISAVKISIPFLAFSKQAFLCYSHYYAETGKSVHFLHLVCLHNSAFYRKIPNAYLLDKNIQG